MPLWARGSDILGRSDAIAASSSQYPVSQSSGSAGSGVVASSSATVDGSGFWVRVLGQCWAVWVRMLSPPACEWTALSATNRGLYRDAVLRLVRQLQDTGVRVPGSSDDFGAGSSDCGALDSAGQIGGSSDLGALDSAGQIGFRWSDWGEFRLSGAFGLGRAD